MELIDGISHFWKLWSVQLGTLTVALAGAVAAVHELPADIQAQLPAWFNQALSTCTAMVAFLAVIARSIKQPNLPPVTDDNRGG